MALRVALVLDGNAQGARSALQQTTADVDKLTAATAQQTAAAQANVAANARAFQSNGNVANIAAQFQDIAVTSAMGMSPLQIALQQGTQLSAVLGQQGAAGAAKMLVAALGSVISPVSLITIAVVALGSAAIQAFGGMLTSASKATMSLEEHDTWLKKILTGYDSAAKAAKTASDAAQTLPKGAVQSNLQADLADKLKQVEDRYKSIVSLRGDFEGYAGYAKAFGVPPEVEQQLASLRDLLQAVTLDGQLSKAEADQLVVALTRLSNNNADQNLKAIASAALENVNALGQLIGMVDATTASLSALQNQAAVAQFNHAMDATSAGIAKMKAMIPELRDGYQQAKDVLTETLKTAETPLQRFAAQQQYEQLVSALDAQKAQQEARKAASSANKVSDYEREIAASRERTASTQLEITTIGQSTYAAERARRILELETAAKKDAIGLSPARVAAIEAEADASAKAAASLENTKAVWADVQRVGESALDSILNAALSGGANIKDVIASIAQEYLKLAIQMSVLNPMKNALFGGGNGVADSGIGGGIASFVASLFGFGKGTGGGVTGGAALAGAALPRREAGGPVVAGQAYLVGERRPEIFVPTSSGTIIPKTSMLAGAGGGGLQFHQTIINRNGSDVQTRQRRQPDGSVYQELVIDATQEGMANDRYRQFGIRGPTKSR